MFPVFLYPVLRFTVARRLCLIFSWTVRTGHCDATLSYRYQIRDLANFYVSRIDRERGGEGEEEEERETETERQNK